MSDLRARFYDSIADGLDSFASSYDLQRRLGVLFDELLEGTIQEDTLLLDAGCGTGHASLRATEAGARTIACDIGIRLAHLARRRTGGTGVCANALALPFADQSFDVVVSSEMIEHTLDPAQTIAELARVLRPGGTMALTCPNWLWQLPVRLASRLRLRPFHGYENFPTWRGLERMFRGADLEIEQHLGLHPWPFQLRWLQAASKRIDHLFGRGPWGRLMINQAILAHRRKAAREGQENSSPTPETRCYDDSKEDSGHPPLTVRV